MKRASCKVCSRTSVFSTSSRPETRPPTAFSRLSNRVGDYTFGDASRNAKVRQDGFGDRHGWPQALGSSASPNQRHFGGHDCHR